jgi:hypothetical protein
MLDKLAEYFYALPNISYVEFEAPNKDKPAVAGGLELQQPECSCSNRMKKKLQFPALSLLLLLFSIKP